MVKYQYPSSLLELPRIADIYVYKYIHAPTNINIYMLISVKSCVDINIYMHILDYHIYIYIYIFVHECMIISTSKTPANEPASIDSRALGLLGFCSSII